MNKKFIVAWILTIAAILCAGIFRPPMNCTSRYYHTKKYMWHCNSDIVIAGDSRIEEGVSPFVLEEALNKKVNNFAFSALNYSSNYLHGIERCLNHKSGKKVIVLGIQANSFVDVNNSFSEIDDMSAWQKFIVMKFICLAPYFESYIGLDQLLKPNPSDKEVLYENGYFEKHRPPVKGHSKCLLLTEKHLKINQNRVNTVLEYTKKWTDDNIIVIGVRMPTCSKMADKQDKQFNITAFSKRFVAAGGVWFSDDSFDYDTYDCSHMTYESAQKFSKKLAAKIKETEDR